MSNILAVLPRRQDLYTSTTETWTDTLPLFQAGPAAVVAGSENGGNGSLTVTAVQPYAAIGPHIVTVTNIGGLVLYSVVDPAGTVAARGVAGVPVQAAGLTLVLTPGSTPFRIGDTFAVQPTQLLIDDSGFSYVLQVRTSPVSPVVVFEATSSPALGINPTIIAGGGTGAPMLLVPDTLMAPDKFPPSSYVYEMIAIADGRRKTTHFGKLTHVFGVAYLP